MSDKDRTGDDEHEHSAEAAPTEEHAAEPVEDGGGDEREQEGAALRVAEALGVDESAGEAAPADEDEAEGPANRAARRREEAIERRRKRKAAAAAPEGEELPKDKNARAKALLERRREQAAGSNPVSAALLPGEMVDDALARTASAGGKWLRKNFGMLQWVVLAAAVAGGGFLFYNAQTEKKAANATDSLLAGVEADRGKVMAEDKREDDEKAFEATRVYKTVEERTEAALAGYRKTVGEHPNSVVSALAQLGEAGALLDKRDYDAALVAYGNVVGSKIAGADADVKGRATEGIGFAREGKGDLDGALVSFTELEHIDSRGYKELGMYHQARVWLAKGDSEKAKELLKQVREKIQTSGPDGKASPHYPAELVDDMLRSLDPSLVPHKPSAFGGPKGGSMTPEELEKLKKMLREAGEKKPHEGH